MKFLLATFLLLSVGCHHDPVVQTAALLPVVATSPPGGGELKAERPAAAGDLREDPVPVDDLEGEIRRKASGPAEALVEYRGPDGFFALAVPVPETVERDMRLKKSWREGCPVPIQDLSYLVLSHWGFDGKPHVGELVMHRKLAPATIQAFGELYAQRFPIERMELIERYDGDDHRSMEANNTSAFNCRYVSGRPGVFSNHSYGSAIDINPVQNPYVVPKNELLKALGWNGAEEKAGFLEKLGYPKTGAVESFCAKDFANCKISPAKGAPYLDRAKPAAGLIVEGPVVRAFASRGFQWGGVWRNQLDYQHFDVKPAKLR